MIDITTVVPLRTVPLKLFEKSTATKVDTWSDSSVEILNKSKRLRIACKECFVTPCSDAQSVRFLTVYSSALTQLQLKQLHLDFCDSFDAQEQIEQFARWDTGDHHDLFRMNKMNGSMIYNFSVHRTYDSVKPWFASIEIAWSCEGLHEHEREKTQFDPDTAGEQLPSK
ncbi:hypothetical protein SH449x_003673 [Pirellulaceae bacterium SH449]